MKHFKLFFLSALVFLIFFSAQAQQLQQAKNVLENLQRLEVSYPQQKVFLHLDRHEYVAGENVWFKAYLVDAISHMPDTMSSSLNVELFNVQGQAVALLLVRMQDGLGYGQIFLPDSLAEGNYRLRSYTNWMLNFGENVFFEQDIFVHNPIEEDFIRRADIRRNRNFNQSLEEEAKGLQLAYFPEGGQLVAGVENRVAFKVTNGLGMAVMAEGKLLDASGQTISSFKTKALGMGAFNFTPQAGQKYQLQVSATGFGVKTLSIAEPLQQSYTLMASSGSGQIDVKVLAGFDPSSLNLSNDLFIIAQTRGKAYFIEEGKLQNRTFETSIPLRLLPSGVAQITVFDGNATPLAERLVFVNHGDQLQPELDVSTSRLGNEQALKIAFDLGFAEGSGEWAHLSLAVEGADKNFENPARSIIVELLMASDLATVSPDVLSFLSTKDAGEEIIDLVMLTHGWRRFKWNDIIAAKFPEIKHSPSKGLVLSGNLSAVSTDQTVSNLLLEVDITQEGRDLYKTRTDSRGNFKIDGLDYNGFFSAEFTLPSETRTRGFRMRLDGSDTPLISFSNNAFTRPSAVLTRGQNWKRVSSPNVAAFTIRAKEIAQHQESIYGTPDQTIFMDDIPVNYTNLIEVFRGRATGIIFERGQLRIRGEGSLQGSNEPLYLVDGVVVSPDILLNLRPVEVDRVEILKGAGTAIFGARGANGVIIAYTKRGGSKAPVFQFNLLGFATPREFFNSRVAVEFKREKGIGHTMFWEPGILPDENGRFSIVFPEREKWKYKRIVLQGIHSSGKLIFREFSLFD